MKNCKDCKSYVNEICKKHPEKLDNILCFLRVIIINLNHLVVSMYNAGELQKKYMTKVGKIIDKAEKDMDEGEEWKK